MEAQWTTWQRKFLTADQQRTIFSVDPSARLPSRIYVNNLYEVWITDDIDAGAFPKLIWLSIKRRDKQPIHDWRQLQRIKTELIGKEHEGVELYPAESRHVDTANQYHLWVLADSKARFPFGYVDRLVAGPDDPRLKGIGPGAVQRPFDPTHQPPD